MRCQMDANDARVVAKQRRPRTPCGGHTLVLAWLVGLKGSKEGGDVAAPSVSRSLTLALLLSRLPSETEHRRRRRREVRRACT